MLRRDLHPDASREIVHRLEKIQAVIFHQETNGVAMRTTPKTVIKLLGGAYGERRSFFTVKRAARGVICSGFLERQSPLNDIDDIYPVKQILNE